MCSSSLQLTFEQQSIGESWIPPKKDTPHPRAKEKYQKDGWRGEIKYTIKLQPTTDAQKAHHETSQRLSQTCHWVAFECLLQRYGLSMACRRGRVSVCSRPGCGISPLRRSPITPPQSRQNLHRTGETDSCRAQTKLCANQDPGERSSDPTGDWPRLACECPGVSSGGVGQQWPAAGSGALCVAEYRTYWRRSPLSSLPPP